MSSLLPIIYFADMSYVDFANKRLTSLAAVTNINFICKHLFYCINNMMILLIRMQSNIMRGNRNELAQYQFLVVDFTFPF